ncbi:GNAT family N-acetyltransferase [Microvirga sp. BT350]|uniref:GNAT family N-acetyltransferase n=2 Tax=Microvirga alba TaxID=2791025 RepID=A0A931BR95_9HYPH|nr:GNAT family N-acetyltransferase [Microvirga alba]MBF9233775.1 GNAT family N-acetyltransferase [Microvirga alba]
MNLAETLADCVAGGASVGFMWPFPVEEAVSWWDGVIENVAAGKTLLFGAYADGVLSGTVQIGLDGPCNQRHRGDVKKLLVHRRARRKGLAQRLLAALEDEARARGLSLLTLDTVTGSDAEQLYEKLGWTKSGVIPDFAMWPDGRLCATTVFWKKLG